MPGSAADKAKAQLEVLRVIPLADGSLLAAGGLCTKRAACSLQAGPAGLSRAALTSARTKVLFPLAGIRRETTNTTGS